MASRFIGITAFGCPYLYLRCGLDRAWLSQMNATIHSLPSAVQIT